MALLGVQVGDRKLAPIFSYPHFKESHYQGVLRDLEELGVSGIASLGDFEVGGVKVIGKGCVGIVCAGLLNGALIAIKILRADANRPNMLREGEMLKAANSCGVGPRLIASKERVLAMDLIRGLPILVWLSARPQASEVERAIRGSLQQAYSLDIAGLDHGELSNASKHVIVDGRGDAWIIDFETASKGRKARNLTSLLSFFFFKEKAKAMMGEYFSWSSEEIRSIISEYKENASGLLYRRALGALGLG